MIKMRMKMKKPINYKMSFLRSKKDNYKLTEV